MSTDARQHQAVFALRSLRAAKVSEISEATAAAAVAPEQRVNFHIGNPVQDDQLVTLYKRLIFGLPLDSQEHSENPLDALELCDSARPRFTFVAHAVEQSVPYLPRGGYGRRDPGPLPLQFQTWLGAGQDEPLDYDLGLKSGERELTFVSGGRIEAIRILFTTLSRTMEHGPARIHCYRMDLPDFLRSVPGLVIDDLGDDEERALQLLKTSLEAESTAPHFLLLGKVMSEEARRMLRSLSLHAPLHFVEANDAPNHTSLGREAGLADRVHRILTPAAVDASLEPSSLAIVVGNAELVKAIETTHFELKGTPSGAEMALCSYLWGLLEDAAPETSASMDQGMDLGESTISRIGPLRTAASSARATRVTDVMHNLAQRVEAIVSRNAEPFERLSQQMEGWVARLPSLRWVADDPCAGMGSQDVIETFFDRMHDPLWHTEIQRALLSAFLSHHPHYDGPACTLVSGSTRTSFGVLGQYCGIKEVVICDLSWTYEHGFERVIAVPLTETLDLDVDGIIAVVSERLQADPHWHEYGAVMLNNPHNASGAVFPQEAVERLLHWLLDHGVWVIDDLSYQDVAPSQSLDDYHTLRQLAERLERNGGLRREQAARLITVHSFSKTDCFAGARLAVTEILDPALRQTFRAVVGSIQPNLAAILMAYLFYRRHADEVGRFWRQRNLILMERMQALEVAVRDLPEERNPYHIRVEAPKGSMYPRLVVDQLPSGVSLDWLASGLAPRGIGLLPFSTFARTARGFDLARKSFRLTLGGKDGPFQLQRKARRVIIDLNRLIEDQETLYCVKALPAAHLPPRSGGILAHVRRDWPAFQKQIVDRANEKAKILLDAYGERLDVTAELRQFTDDYLPFRLQILQQRLIDRAQLADAMIEGGKSNGGLRLLEQLERETRSVSLEEKQANFRSRLYDRTVHPTQMYALDVDLHIDHLTRLMVKQHPVDLRILHALADGLAAEYVGGNVSISSDQEADEMVVDLYSLADAQNLASLGHDLELPALLSFWGDWDGSTRPSGQGHRLAAGALLANVTELSRLWKCIHRAAPGMRLDPSLAEGIRRLEGNSREFWALLNEITELTSQLEKRYLRVLPFDVKAGFWRRMGMRMHLARDPISRLWQHNDRLERRMYKLRQQRSASLEQYLQLNQRLQESLHEHVDAIQPLLRDPDVALRVGRYRNALKRFVLTPRIHQRMILSRDQFAIDTTVHNIVEINRMAGRYGVPGLVLAIQVSMSSDPEALIALDRKLQQQRREVLRNAGEIPLPGIWVVPLFENIATIHSLESYMDRVWEYALQSRRLGQESADRFREIVCEVFFAGSDLSQQIGQPAGEAVYREAKYQLVQWLSRHDLTEDVRIKFGSGEPAQRQSGYYDARGTRPPVLQSASTKRRLHSHLGDSSRRAWEWAHSPLRGIQAGGEFRTFQSNLAERMRFLPTQERMGLLFHVWQSQAKYEDELHRAASALKDTRLHFEQHSLRELETLTIGQRDAAYQEFLDLAQQNFRQILYGREEDVVGIHVISHFASRAVPPLRDRPVVRPSQSGGDGEGQAIVGKLARTLPLARHGSMLRAIGHNHAQTMMLGVNQLTTGLFRALNEFSLSRQSGSERLRALEDIVLPRLNVYDMLHTLRVYHDPRLEHVRELELMFPAGNSAFVALREDNDLTPHFIPMLQRELMRRSGMDVSDAFAGGQLKPALLPAIQPDLAVLLQPDLFNRDWTFLQGQIGDAGDPEWAAAMQALLLVPDQVRAWRSRVWNIIKTPIRTQVESFVGLALAIHSLRMGGERSSAPLVAEPAEVERLGSQVAELLRDAADDPLRQFLVAAVQYLTELPGTQTEVPVDVLRALRDVERIVKIEEQALGPQQQALVRFYMLKIARLCGENG